MHEQRRQNVQREGRTEARLLGEKRERTLGSDFEELAPGVIAPRDTRQNTLSANMV